MNIIIIATECEQQTVRTSHFARGRSFLDISGASGSQKKSRMPILHQKASQMTTAPLHFFVLK
jgi:hypothetical protein